MSSSTDPGGGGFTAPIKRNKPAWVSLVVRPGLPCWSPSEQTYPPLGQPQVTQPPELFERAGRGPPRPAAVKDIRFVSGRGFVPSPTDNSEVQDDIGKMRPAGKPIKFLRRPGRRATSGGVSVNLTSKTVMPEGMDVRATARGKDAEGDRPDVVLSMIAGEAPSLTSADESSVDSVVTGAESLVVAEAASSADFAGVASPADLAGVFPADLAGTVFPAVAGVASPAVLAGMVVPAVAGVASPAVLAGMAVPAVAGAASLAVVQVATSNNRMEAAGSLGVCGSRIGYRRPGRLGLDMFG